jgi:hypothetical protein
MNAFRFLDIQFQKRAIDISKMKSDTYDVKVGGEAQALRMLLEALRIFYKWYAVPKVIAQFLAVKIGLMAEPISPLIPVAAPKLEPAHAEAQAQAKCELTVVPTPRKESGEWRRYHYSSGVNGIGA